MNIPRIDVAPAATHALRRPGENESPVSRLDIDTTPVGGDDVWSNDVTLDIPTPSSRRSRSPHGSNACSSFADSPRAGRAARGGFPPNELVPTTHDTNVLSPPEIQAPTLGEDAMSVTSGPSGDYCDKAMVLDFDLTLIPSHTSGHPRAEFFEDLCADLDYYSDLQKHLAQLREGGFDLYIVTRGNADAVAAALGRTRDCKGLRHAFRGIYGADEASPVTRSGIKFTQDDLEKIASVAPLDVCQTLKLESVTLPQTERGRVETSAPSIGRGTEPLANKWWWCWRKCSYLQQIFDEGGYSAGNVWFADDTLENVQAVDRVFGGQVNTIYVDGMHGRGIMRNATYRAAATRLCAAGEGETHSDDCNAAALSQLSLQQNAKT